MLLIKTYIKHIQTLYSVRVCLMFFIALVMLYACSNDLQTVEQFTYKDKTPDEAAENITMTYSDTGVVVVIVKSPKLNKYEGDDPYFDFPEGVYLESYENTGKINMTLTCNYAISYEYTGILEAQGNVVINDLIKGEVLETEHIVWNQKERRIYSDVFVKQTKADGSVSFGSGFDADDTFSKYSIRNPKAEMITNDF